MTPRRWAGLAGAFVCALAGAAFAVTVWLPADNGPEPTRILTETSVTTATVPEVPIPPPTPETTIPAPPRPPEPEPTPTTVPPSTTTTTVPPPASDHTVCQEWPYGTDDAPCSTPCANGTQAECDDWKASNPPE